MEKNTESIWERMEYRFSDNYFPLIYENEC